MRPAPVLYIIVPCYNEQEVLPRTAPLFIKKLNDLEQAGQIAPASSVLFVNDGSRDDTWSIITTLAEHNSRVKGISQSRNRGHQNAVLAGLMEARELCDVSISIDCDGQDDINAMDEMIARYREGYDVVYGVRSSRETDTFFKRATAQAFYKLLSWLGADVVYNHADYRLLSSRVMRELARFHEVNIYLRGMVPLVGFKSCEVTYERHVRIAGESHYPLTKMLSLALDGITSLSIKPIRLIIALGALISIASFIGVAWAVITVLIGQAVSGWASMISVVFFLGGVQLICLGVIGEYVGKTYLEAKARPRYIISERTWDQAADVADGSRGQSEHADSPVQPQA